MHSRGFKCSRLLQSGLKLASSTAVVALAGCSWTVVPPTPPPPTETVFLSQYGWHTRLALPVEDEAKFVEFGFGDWRYYALGERSTGSGLRALFFSESATLSRRELVAPSLHDPTAHFGSRRSVGLKLPEEKVATLRRELEKSWREATGSTRRAEGLAFRKVDQDYGLFHNSNHLTAEWLEALGCKVRGPTLLGNFRVKRD